MSNILHADSGIEPWITANGLQSAQRMQIYRHIVDNTLTEALQTSYPAVLLLVGDPFFKVLADRYMRQYPPRTGNLQDYGAQLYDLLATMAEAASVPYLSDIARLEWARQQSFLATEDETLEASEIAYRFQYLGDSPIRMVLHPSVQLLCSEHPVFNIWHYCMELPSKQLHLNGGGQSVLLWRDGTQIAMQVMDRPATVFLAAILADVEIHQAFLQVRTEGHVNFDLSDLLPFLVTNRLIIEMGPVGANT